MNGFLTITAAINAANSVPITDFCSLDPTNPLINLCYSFDMLDYTVQAFPAMVAYFYIAIGNLAITFMLTTVNQINEAIGE
jgi:hypothetical protein